MGCCLYQPAGDGLDGAFTVDASRITFGRGCLQELGDRAAALGMTRVALFSDAIVSRLSVFDTAQRSLRAAGIDVITYTDVHVEPTDESFTQAAAFASEAAAGRLCLRRRRLGDRYGQGGQPLRQLPG